MHITSLTTVSQSVFQGKFYKDGFNSVYCILDIKNIYTIKSIVLDILKYLIKYDILYIYNLNSMMKIIILEQVIILGVTIKDIAKLSGVGISTVSRVINGTGSVSDETRKKVMDVVHQYNYIPNNSARNLKVTQTRNIALLVKGIINPFFGKMIRIIEHEVSMRGYTLLLRDVTYVTNELDVAIREAQDHNLCGVILMGGTFNYQAQKFVQLKIPCVLLTVSAGKDVDLSLYSSVKIDDEKEGFRVAEYLISLGHRKIGFIYDDMQNTPNGLRYKGYCKALEKNGIPYRGRLVATANMYSDDLGYNAGFQMMRQLYSKNHDMTAVIAFSDVLAVGAAKAILSMGMRIPDDISIIGFDGSEAGEFFHPALDTAYQPAKEMALTSIETLMDMIQGGKSKNFIYDTVLLKRGSTKPIEEKR